MSEQNIGVVRAIYDAFGRGDVPAVLGAFDADIEWHEAAGLPYGGVHRGPEAVATNVFGPITTDVENFSVNPEEYLDAGDEVVSLGRYRGRGVQSGAELDLPFAHAWTVRGDKVTRFRQYVDTQKFNEMLAGQAVS